MSVEQTTESQSTPRKSLNLDDQLARTVNLTFFDILEDKLSRRTKEDIHKLQLYLPQPSYSENKDQAVQINSQNDKQSFKDKIDFKFPCYLMTCGHVQDFLQVLERYSNSKEWSCEKCRNIEKSLKNIKVFKSSDLNLKPHVPRKQFKSDQINESIQKSNSDNVLQMLLEVQNKIKDLSLMQIEDVSQIQNEQKNNEKVKNYRIENLFDNQSLQHNQAKLSQKKLTFSPILGSNKKNNSRSVFTKSTASSNNSKPDNAFSKRLTFGNAQSLLTPSLVATLAPNEPQLNIGQSKSELKRNWKLNSSALSSSFSNNEFKVPSPRKQELERQSNKFNYNKKRNRSQARDQLLKYQVQITQKNSDTQSETNQSNLKKRPLSSKREDQQEINVHQHRRISQQIFQQQQFSARFNDAVQVKNYKRQRFN